MEDKELLQWMKANPVQAEKIRQRFITNAKENKTVEQLEQDRLNTEQFFSVF